MVLTALLDARIFNNVKINGKKERILVNGDSLTLPYKKLMDVYFMNMAGITRGIDDVLAKGLAKLVHQGGGGKHDQSVFALAEDYLRWTPGVVFYKRPKVIRRGFQDPANQRHRKNSRSQNDRLIRIAK
ncbi:hypothetical protein Dole_0639 [Desulfosudis oleivorans Hxd3]|uniref:Uncharacterized protein n=2 Tax=Desulfosudis TaxID=2904716 RepID=A8ZUN6_DESOH|nr:hypothetical protein Dole_0639 [Desulfosudis oleivorans Hxd3]